MPELPEVETVRRDLTRLVSGATVREVECLQPGMLTAGCPADLQRALRGARVTEIGRHGKALALRFSSGYSLLVHFRMTGQLYPIGADEPLPGFTRTVLHLSDGRRLVHVDTRRLGTLELILTQYEASARTLANLGPDALLQPPTPRRLAALLSRRKCAIKLLLLDQRALAGIGNIYACEILQRARIAPQTPCEELTSRQIARLARTVGEVLAGAIEARGTTISDYRTGTGAPGGFQERLAVYGREGERCLRPGCRGKVHRIVQGQRSTYYCPVCQRQRRAREK